MLERDIERVLKLHVEQRGGECFKFVPTHHKGMPDRLVILPNGKYVWVELKAEGGRVSKIQAFRHERLRALGCDVRVVVGKRGVLEFCREVDHAI